MQLFLSFLLVISFATFQLAFGDDNNVHNFTDGSSQDQEVAAEFETMEDDDDQADDDAEYRWLAPELYDEMQKRAVAAGQEEGEELKKNKKKGGGGNKNKNENKNKKKNKKKKKKKKKPAKKFKNKEMKLWIDNLGCYRDKGVRAWQDPSIRAITTLYKNMRKPSRIDWSWGHFLQVIMTCAQAAQVRGYACFGIEFYGECWGSYNACDTYARYGNSSKCIKGVGLHWALYVYRAKCGSVYGCCPDGAMPANGTYYEGCPDCVTAVDVVFIIDSSGSIGEENFRKVKKVIGKLIRHFSVSASYARIGIVQYATYARVIYTLRRSQRLGFYILEKRVKKLFYTKGGTKTGRGLELAYRMLRHSKRRLDGKILKHKQVAVVLTDGMTSDDDARKFRVSSVALKAVSHVVAVGVAGSGYTRGQRRLQRAELDQIASSPRDRFFEMSFDSLRDHVAPIARRACPV